MAYDAEILQELKKMNSFLEKMDWKLWNLHKKYVEEDVTTSSTPVEKEQTVEKDVEPVVPAAKYPTIETWE